MPKAKRSVTWNEIREWSRRYTGRCPFRLADLAEWINENMPGFVAHMEDWSYTPDKAPSGCRYRIDGVRREGKRLAVYSREAPYSFPVFTHIPMEPYRHNSQVCRWIVERMLSPIRRKGRDA